MFSPLAVHLRVLSSRLVLVYLVFSFLGYSMSRLDWLNHQKLFIECVPYIIFSFFYCHVDNHYDQVIIVEWHDFAHTDITILVFLLLISLIDIDFNEISKVFFLNFVYLLLYPFQKKISTHEKNKTSIFIILIYLLSHIQ